MSWWNKNRKTLLLAITIPLFLAAVIAISVAMLRPTEFAQICTLVGCGGGIEVEFSGMPAATPYQVILSFPAGEPRTLSCGTGVEDNSNPFEKSCLFNGAFFNLEPDSLPPEEVTVTVIVDGRQVSQVFYPDYKKFQPNGENCAPICYSATVRMNISQ